MIFSHPQLTELSYTSSWPRALAMLNWRKLTRFTLQQRQILPWKVDFLTKQVGSATTMSNLLVIATQIAHFCYTYATYLFCRAASVARSTALAPATANAAARACASRPQRTIKRASAFAQTSMRGTADTSQSKGSSVLDLLLSLHD